MKETLVIISLLFPYFLWSQSPQDTTHQPFIKKSSLIVLPVAFYTPETRLGGGLATIFAFRFRGEGTDTKSSQTQFGAAYTLENQLLLYLPFQIYFQNESYFVYGELGYYNFVYQFFGIGNETQQEDQEAYFAKFPRLRLNFLKKIAPTFYLGGRYWYDNYQITKTAPEGIIETQDIPGQEGGIISGLGLIGNLDSRDEVFYPTEGTWLEASFFINQKFLGSDFNYTRLTADFSHYFALGKRQIIAANFFSDFIFGNAPFQQLALIGGPKKMRGYFEGRFRDKKLIMIQGEYRKSIFKRFGFVGFAGVGSVGSTFSELAEAKVRWSFGGGLRFQLSKTDKINLRLDFGFDEFLDWYPYLTVNEAF
jgi:outer membrane protein assembly factor BamA